MLQAEQKRLVRRGERPVFFQKDRVARKRTQGPVRFSYQSHVLCRDTQYDVLGRRTQGPVQSYETHVLCRDKQHGVLGHTHRDLYVLIRCVFCVEAHSTLHREIENLFNRWTVTYALLWPPTSLCFTALSIKAIPLDSERRKLHILLLHLVSSRF